MPWRRGWQPTLVFLSGESHGQRSQAGDSPWGSTESDTTEATLTCMHNAVQIWRNHGYRGAGGPTLNYMQSPNRGTWMGRVDIPTTHVVQGQRNSAPSGHFHLSADLTFQLSSHLPLLKTLYLTQQNMMDLHLVALMTSFLLSLNDLKSVHPKLNS